jgi:hypothetical protein
MNCININDNFIINDIVKKNYYEYGKFDEKLDIAEIKRIFVFTHDPYLFYVKTIVNYQKVICPRSPLDFIKTLKNITVGSYTNKSGESPANLYDIFKMGSGILSVKNQFLVNGVKFYSKDPCYLSLFQSYPYDNPLHNNYYIIKPFLDHIFNIISEHNNDLYNYIFNWISYILQNPGSKKETAFIIIGEQGTSKNKFFTDAISKLFSRYSIANENIINNIIVRFNSSFENKILVICNEFQSLDNGKHLNTDRLKSLITDNTCTIESKFVNSRTIENVSTFIFAFNNYLPI